MKKKLVDQVSDIIVEAANKSESLIKDAVRERMTKQPHPNGFLFAMGTHFWTNKNGDIVDSLKNTQDIDAACSRHLRSFGTITWTIDRIDGELVEKEEW